MFTKNPNKDFNTTPTFYNCMEKLVLLVQGTIFKSKGTFKH